MNEQLFDDFVPQTYTDWLTEVTKELKDKALDDFLTFKTDDDITLNSFYTNATNPINLPNKPNNHWALAAEVVIDDDIAKANKRALEELKGGASAIRFKGNYVSEQAELDGLLADIQFDIIDLHFDCDEANALLYYILPETCNSRGIDTTAIKGSFYFDPLGDLTARGYADYPEAEAFRVLASILNDNQLPNFKTLNVNAKHFHNAGATTVQELAYTLAHTAEYFIRLGENRVNPATIAEKLQFTIAIGGNYFLEIGKIQALNILWFNLLKYYNLTFTSPIIFAETALANKTVYGAQTNMLRATTEVMAAAVGGVNTILVNPFDDTYKRSDTFSRRIARNTQLVAAYESFLTRVANPLNGAYYVSEITNSLVDKAWELFLEIEKQGGFLACLKNGSIQQAIKQSAQSKIADAKDKKSVFVGANKYVDSNERMLHKITKTVTEDKFAPTKTVEPLEFVRFVSAAEADNLALEKNKAQLN